MRRQRNSNIVTIILNMIVWGLFLGACSQPHPLTPPPDSDTVRVQRNVFVSGIDDVGLLKAVHNYPVASEGYGQIARIAAEGSYVQKGDPVFWLDTKRIDQQIEEAAIKQRQAFSNYERAVEALAEEKFNLEQTLKEKQSVYAFDKLNVERKERELKQFQDRYARQLISEADVLETETQLEQLRLTETASQLALERAELEYDARRKSAELDLDIARQDYDQSSVLKAFYEKRRDYYIGYAPTDGVVVIKRHWTKEPFKVGDSIYPGTTLLEIPDMAEMMVWTQVSEAYLSRVYEGQPVWIRIPALENAVLEGAIDSISWLAMPRRESRGTIYAGSDGDGSQGKVFEIAVRLTTQDEQLRTGMNVSVVFVEERIPDVLTVPISAIGHDQSGPHVFVYKNGRFIYRSVELGPRNRLEAVVTRGLEPGMRVALFSLAAKTAPESGLTDKGL
ncbi:MAG: HlyD family efflux transporter periplasmic adaptor subunit [bacterium]